LSAPRKRGAWQKVIYNNLRDYGYPGPRVPDQIRGQKEVFGQPCYPSLRELPERVDHCHGHRAGDRGGGRAPRRRYRRA